MVFALETIIDERILPRAEMKEAFRVDLVAEVITGQRDLSEGSETVGFYVKDGIDKYFINSYRADESEIREDLHDMRERVLSALDRVKNDENEIHYKVTGEGQIEINPGKRPRDITMSELRRWTFPDGWVASVSGRSLNRIVRSREGVDGRHCGEVMYRDALSIARSEGMDESRFRERIESEYHIRIVPDPEKPRPAAPKKSGPPPGMLFDIEEFKTPQAPASEIDHLNPDGSRKSYEPRK